MKIRYRCVLALALLCVSSRAERRSDQLQRDPKIVLPAMVRAADRAVVLRFDGTKWYGVHVVDPDWNERFAAVLQTADYKPDDPCFCIGYPMVEFYLGDRSLTISMQHGDVLRCSSGAISGDFRLGKAMVEKLTALLAERRKIEPPDPKELMPIQKMPIPAPSEIRANKPMEPMARTVTPRADARVAPVLAMAHH